MIGEPGEAEERGVAVGLGRAAGDCLFGRRRAGGVIDGEPGLNAPVQRAMETVESAAGV